MKGDRWQSWSKVLEVENPGLRVRQRNGTSAARRLLNGGQQSQKPVRSDPSLCRGKSSFHVVDCPKRDDAELTGVGQGFSACGPDLDVRKIQGAYSLAQEGSLLILGFSQRDLNARAEENCDGQAGKAGSGADVKQRDVAGIRRAKVGVGRREVAGGEEALAKVAADDLFGIRMAVRLVRAFHLSRRSR